MRKGLDSCTLGETLIQISFTCIWTYQQQFPPYKEGNPSRQISNFRYKYKEGPLYFFYTHLHILRLPTSINALLTLPSKANPEANPLRIRSFSGILKYPYLVVQFPKSSFIIWIQKEGLLRIKQVHICSYFSPFLKKIGGSGIPYYKQWRKWPEKFGIRTSRFETVDFLNSGLGTSGRNHTRERRD